jgi:predicted nucleotidyltransferase
LSFRMLRAAERRSVHKGKLDAEVENLTLQLIEMGAERVILFGSLASDRVRLTSDIDLLVVIDLPGRFLDRQLEVYNRLDFEEPLDIFVYTPQEFESGKRRNRLIRHALKTGKVIYEKG